MNNARFLIVFLVVISSACVITPQITTADIFKTTMDFESTWIPLQITSQNEDYSELNKVQRFSNDKFSQKNINHLNEFIPQYIGANVLEFSTFIGGTSESSFFNAATDSNGNVYIIGETFATDFPVLNAFQNTSKGGYDSVIMKFNSTGSLLFSTYFGGLGTDWGRDVTVDSKDNVYITGLTSSTDFPTTSGAIQKTYGGGAYDAFLSKFNSTGNLLYSTYLGGNKDEESYKIVTDSQDNLYFSGTTSSLDFPTLHALQSSYNGGPIDNVLTKFNSSGSLIFSTYLGGDGRDTSGGLAIDQNDNIVLGGSTDSTNYPILKAYQKSKNGQTDVVLTKFNSTGSLLFSTYFGASTFDNGNDVAVDSKNNIYVTGSTDSLSFPTINAYQTSYGGGVFDAFLSKFNSSGSPLFSTFLGGINQDVTTGVAVDSRDNAYIIGGTYSSNFPTLNAYNRTYGGTGDVFLSKFNSTGSFLFSSYFGGTSEDLPGGVTVSRKDNIYIAGATYSPNFPIQKAYQATKPSSNTVRTSFFAQLDLTAPTKIKTLNATAVSGSQINLHWSPATDDQGVKGYNIFRDGAYIGSIPSTSFADIELKELSSHSYTVSAFDKIGHIGKQSATVTVSTLDVTAPTRVNALNILFVSDTQRELNWNPATDNMAVTTYNIYRDGILLNTTVKTSYLDSGLKGGTTYTYTVAAVDAAGNIGVQSKPVTITTQTPVPTQTPQPSTSKTQTPTSTIKGGTPFPFLPLLFGLMLIVVWRRKNIKVIKFK